MRHRVVSSSVKDSTSTGFANASPLFEEKWHARDSALFTDGDDPLPLHCAGTVSAFAPDDYPMNSREVNLSQVFKQRFDGKETHRGGAFLEMFNSGNSK